METSSPLQQAECRSKSYWDFAFAPAPAQPATVRLTSLFLRALPWLGAAGCAGGAVFNLVRLEATLPQPPVAPDGTPVDAVTRAEARFQPVHAALMARGVRGNVGYLSDFPKEELAAAPRGIERYFQAQFALAPLILNVDGREDWIVTDWEQPGSTRRQPAGWTVVTDFGAGVRLLHRSP
jgi:hypothetical protein